MQLEKHGVCNSYKGQPQAYNERLKTLSLNQLSILNAHGAFEPHSLERALHHGTFSVTALISHAAS